MQQPIPTPKITPILSVSVCRIEYMCVNMCDDNSCVCVLSYTSGGVVQSSSSITEAGPSVYTHTYTQYIHIHTQYTHIHTYTHIPRVRGGGVVDG